MTLSALMKKSALLQQQQGRGGNDQQVHPGLQAVPGFRVAVDRGSGGSGHGSLAEGFM